MLFSMRRARLFVIFSLVLTTILISALPALAEHPCELPHQKISVSCDGHENLKVVSGISKNTALNDLLKAYREKSREAGEIVAGSK